MIKIVDLNIIETNPVNIPYPLYMGGTMMLKHINKIFDKFHKWAKELKPTKIHLLCKGSSGMFLATHLKVLHPKIYNIIYVRDESELDKRKHESVITEFESYTLEGKKIKLNLDFKKDLFVFIDDFIEKGETLKNCLISLKRFLNGYKKNIKIKRLAILNIEPYEPRIDVVKKIVKGYIDIKKVYYLK